MYVRFLVLNSAESLQRILSDLPYPGLSVEGWLALREYQFRQLRRSMELFSQGYVAYQQLRAGFYLGIFFIFLKDY